MKKNSSHLRALIGKPLLSKPRKKSDNSMQITGIFRDKRQDVARHYNEYLADYFTMLDSKK